MFRRAAVALVLLVALIASARALAPQQVVLAPPLPSCNVPITPNLANSTYWAPDTSVTAASHGSVGGIALQILTEGSNSGSHGDVAKTGNRPTLVNGVYTMQAYLVAGTRRYVVVLIAAGSTDAGIVVDTQNWTALAGAVNWVIVGVPAVRPQGNGLYKVSFTFIQNQSTESGTVPLIRGSSTYAVAQAPSYTGNGSTIIAAIPACT